MSFRIVPLVKGTAPPIALYRPVLLIGRHLECDVRIDSPKISRRHCCVAIAYDRVVIRDLGSRNGVRVNGRLLEEARLQSGDELAIGPILFRFELESESPDATLTPTSREAGVSSAARPAPVAPSLQSAAPTSQPSRPDSDIELVPLDDI
jgi:pSer/pThr/pTyr-binding forkhead associated (FHA) protein